MDLDGLDIGVAEHFGDRLNGHSILQGDGGGKGMPGNVEGHVLVDVADGRNLLEIVVTLLV